MFKGWNISLKKNGIFFQAECRRKYYTKDGKKFFKQKLYGFKEL